MKIILHMGQTKTGTTALQVSLGKASEALRARNVLYPQAGYVFFAHHLLLALCGCEHRFSARRLAQLGGPQGAVKAARQAWQMTCEDISRRQPALLVLSSEYLIYGTDAAAKVRLASLLGDLSDDITTVIYVRHPVDHYRARLQEWVKQNDGPCPPGDTGLKQTVDEITSAFGRRPELVLFDRASMHGGDTIIDFATRFLSPHVDAGDLPRVDTNVGLSAEALILMAQLRAEAGGTIEALERVSSLIPILAALDKGDPARHPFTLRPEVAEAALRSAVSHRWLAETGRLHIPGFDIDRIDGAAVPDWMKTAPPTSLFQHDADRLSRLRLALNQHQALGAAPGRIADVSEKPISRIRDLLLRFLLGRLASRQDRNTGAASGRIQPVRQPSQGDLNEDHSTAGKFDAGAGDGP
jgi:hypothetical protein